MQLAFGSGALWGERTDVQIGTTGGNGAVQFGVVQDVQVDFDWTDKPLYGQLQFPVAIGRGQGKITGKVKLAQIKAKFYTDLFFGLAGSSATGAQTVAIAEAITVAGVGASYANVVANGAHYVDDCGVRLASTNIPYVRVDAAATPTTGQYKVDYTTGTYTFAAADTTFPVVIDYLYALTTGNKITISNVLMGYIPTFKATFYTIYSTKGMALRLNACTSTKLTLPTKIDDWTIHEMDFDAFADASGTIGYMSVVE